MDEIVCLNGNIVQKFGLSHPRLIFTDYFNTEYYGGFGATCWYIQFSKLYGFKIYNSVGFKKLKEVKNCLNNRVKILYQLHKIANPTCHNYIPKTYRGVIVQHTGDYIAKGYKKPKSGKNNGIYFPAFVVQHYNVNLNFVVEEKLKKKIHKDFLSCGIKLHPDSWGGRQIGHSQNNIVLFDITDCKGTKYL